MVPAPSVCAWVEGLVQNFILTCRKTYPTQGMKVFREKLPSFCDILLFCSSPKIENFISYESCGRYHAGIFMKIFTLMKLFTAFLIDKKIEKFQCLNFYIFLKNIFKILQKKFFSTFGLNFSKFSKIHISSSSRPIRPKFKIYL